MSDDAHWELYRSFRGVLEESSLSGAARALGVAQPTVGRHIAALEKSLGLALFLRSQAGLIPTEAALELRHFAEAMKSNAAAMRRAAMAPGEGIRGTVRITASEMISVEVLPPILARLQIEHPELKLEIVMSNRVQDLLRREADIAVRMTQPKQELLIARRVGAIELGLHAHVDYLARRGTPKTAKDLAGHTLIGFDEETPFLRSARKRYPDWQRERFALRADSDIMQMALLRAGAGLGICQLPIAARDPALVRVLPRYVKIPLETWLVMHEDLRNSPRCRVTFDALLGGLLKHAG